MKQAKLFDGVRHDSGDPLSFADKTIEFYERNRIEPISKTIVFSDSLNIDTIKAIKEHIGGRIHDTYGIGTFFSNDVGVKALNMVIKLTDIKAHKIDTEFLKAVKLSDVAGKHTGDISEIQLSKMTLGLK